jgi:hypothetical protein
MARFDVAMSTMTSATFTVSQRNQPMRTQFGRPRGLVLFYVSLAFAAVGGCVPEEQWLNDSSGFVYQVGKETSQEIWFYDIGRRAERVIWSGSIEAGFALDPARAMLCIVEPKRRAGGMSLSCRLSVYDIKSNRFVRSTRWIAWQGNQFDAGALSLTKLPNRESHFLVMDARINGPRRNTIRHAILNADTESLIDVSGLDLKIIPDGSGFLARTASPTSAWHESLTTKKKLDAIAVENLCRESVWLVDLKGVRHRMMWDGSALRRAAARYDEEFRKAEPSPEPGKANYLGLLSNEPGEWQTGGVGSQQASETMILLLGHKDGAMQIDIRRRTITDVVGRTVATSDQRAPVSSESDSGISVLLVKLKDVEYWANILKKSAPGRGGFVGSLEVRWPAQGKAKTLLDRIDFTFSSPPKASPNGLYAVLKYAEPDKDAKGPGLPVHCLILGNSGNIFDRLFFHHVDTRRNDALEPWREGQ